MNLSGGLLISPEIDQIDQIDQIGQICLIYGHRLAMQTLNNDHLHCFPTAQPMPPL